MPVDYSICVCVSRDDSFVSRFIRFWSRAKVSHAFITCRVQPFGRVFAMESTATGFRLTPWSKWRRKHTLVARYRVAMPLLRQINALGDLSEYLGTRYDYKSLLGFGRVSNKYNSSTRLICSEAVAMFLLKSGLDDFSQPETWTPGDLYKEFEQHSKLERVEP